MKIKQLVFLLLILKSFTVLGQPASIAPHYMPDYVYGNWVNEDNKIKLIFTRSYVVIGNELYNYYEVIKENDKIDFTCVNNRNKIKYIRISIINKRHIILDEGFETIPLTKSTTKNSEKIPETLINNWYAEKEKMELKETEVLYSDNAYKIDYVATTDQINYFIVVYLGGDYSLLYNSINDTGSYLNANFSKTILFKEATFYQNNKPIVLSFFVLTMVLFSVGLIKWKIASTKKKEVTKRLFTEMQLKSFRSQMNPHFLFNALSAIQNLINKGDNEKANHYLTEFSQLMRLTLDKTDKGLVPLEDEIESIKKYLEIEKLRFHFNYNIFIDSNINKSEIEIPAMLVQPFVENAIIHGLNEKNGEKNLRVEFKINDENLVCNVVDDGVGINVTKARKSSDLNREKYGLKLAKDRIKLINESYKTHAEIEIIDISELDKNKTGTQVKIQIPLRY